MKLRLLAASVVLASCGHSAMAAQELTSGTINNETINTAVVSFSSDVQINSKLTATKTLRTSMPPKTVIASGSVEVANGHKARLALQNQPMDVYAENHANDAAYKLTYRSVPTDGEANYDYMLSGDKTYIVTPEERSNLDYQVQLVNAPYKAGQYTISTVTAIYNP